MTTRGILGAGTAGAAGASREIGALKAGEPEPDAAEAEDTTRLPEPDEPRSTNAAEPLPGANEPEPEADADEIVPETVLGELPDADEPLPDALPEAAEMEPRCAVDCIGGESTFSAGGYRGLECVSSGSTATSFPFSFVSPSGALLLPVAATAVATGSVGTTGERAWSAQP